MNKGTQIIYVPDHAKGDPDHPDCERGFITSKAAIGPNVWCRFWSKTDPGELRTKANSEVTPVRNIVCVDTVDQAQVWQLIDELYPQENPQ